MVTISGFTITPSLNHLFNDTEAGIFIRTGSQNCSISDCIISNFNNSIIAGTLYGIRLDGENCLVYGNNLQYNQYGLYSNRILSGNANNIVYANTINNNYFGIYCSHSYGDGNNIMEGYDNNITDNNFGLRFHFSKNNKFYHNNIINNAIQVDLELSGSNVWDNGYPDGGNYWSDYNGSDINGDGIGDEAYIINIDNQDRYPQVNIIPEFPSIFLFSILIFTTLLSSFIFKLEIE